MEGSRTELKVGLTVMIAVAIFAIAFFWVKGVRLHRDYYRVDVWFPNVGSLEIGDPVSVSGVRRGKVESLALDRGGVRVGVSLGSDVKLRSDAMFTIKNVGLMGERFIDVATGAAPDPWPADSIPRGLYDTGIPEVMGLIGGVTGELRELVIAIRSSIGSDTTLSRLVRVSENLEHLSQQVTGLVDEHRSGLTQTMDNLKSASQELRRTIEDNSATVGRTVHRFDSAATKLNNFAGQLDTLSRSVRAIVDSIGGGSGSLSRLIKDDQLVRRWEAAAKEIDALVADIRANPRKYLSVQVKLF
jgi:phospholipid/cholesterol/gamma-HCH transport system substrate-binding protein